MKALVSTLLLALFTTFAHSAEAEPLAKTVEYLIATVEKSDCKFVRNGDEHTGKEAAAHIRRKYDHFKKQIKTPEDFIDKCATKSELSGKPYTVKLPDGSTQKCDEWLKAKLADHNKGAGN